MIIERYLQHGVYKNSPNKIVVHCMAEYILDPDAIHAAEFLDNYGLSAHALIAPNGDIYLLREEDEGAYHARGHNTNSLGIEFLVAGQHDYGSFVETIKTPYVTDEQWDAGVEVVQNWLLAYPIETLVRHSDISPGRKVDPGAGFPWDSFLTEVGWT
jgi:N-acetyl-anhydromuramyl-L-alanine amidase AmpD